jgi:hypothetical protein
MVTALGRVGVGRHRSLAKGPVSSNVGDVELFDHLTQGVQATVSMIGHEWDEVIVAPLLPGNIRIMTLWGHVDLKGQQRLDARSCLGKGRCALEPADLQEDWQRRHEIPLRHCGAP